ncbi:hypothetical protein ACU19_03660 [Actinobaculum suis]|nr:hypothetical protein ACU19_03660 [Actinobaculum suis]
MRACPVGGFSERVEFAQPANSMQAAITASGLLMINSFAQIEALSKSTLACKGSVVHYGRISYDVEQFALRYNKRKPRPKIWTTELFVT